jgi:hypothetical protein
MAEMDMPVYSFMSSSMSIPNPISRIVRQPGMLLPALNPVLIQEEPDGISVRLFVTEDGYGT